MAKASNALTSVGIVVESVYGTTPTTPSLIKQRLSSGNFVETKAELLDDTKTGSRQYSYIQQGNSAVSGSIAGNFAHDNYDALLESALYGTFSSNVLKMGDTRKSFTIEEAQPDVGVYRQFTGMIANGFQLSSPAEGLTTISFELMGKGQTVAGTSLDSNGYTAQPEREPFKSADGVVTEGGSTIAYVSSIALSVSNNISPAYGWGAEVAEDMIPGRAEVTGTMEVFFTNNALLNKFLSGAYSSLSFQLTDGTNTMTFSLPKIKYTGVDMPIEAGEGQRILSLPFRAVYDSTEQTTLKITRSA